MEQVTETRRLKGIIIVLFLSFMIWIVPEILTCVYPSNDEVISLDEEWREVYTATVTFMENVHPPITDLSTDYRVLAFVDCGCDEYGVPPNATTQDMTDEGLVTISEEYLDILEPISIHLGKDSSQYWYCVTQEGHIRGFYEKGPDSEELLASF